MPESNRRHQAPEACALSAELIALLTGRCTNKNSFERSLKRSLLTNLGEAKDERCQLFEAGRRVLTSPVASLRFVKKRFRLSEKGFGQQAVEY